MREEILPCFPATGYEVSYVRHYGMVLVKVDYLTSPLQPVDDAQQGVRYGFMIDAARKLVSALTDAIEKAEQTAGTAPQDELN